MEITKDMTIGELIEKAPEKVNILLEAGMHCLGCPASARWNNWRSMWSTWNRCRRNNKRIKQIGVIYTKSLQKIVDNCIKM